MKSIVLALSLLGSLAATGQHQPLENLYQELSQYPQCVALDYQPGRDASFSLDFVDPSLKLTCSGHLEKVRVLLIRQPITTQEVLAQTLLALGFQRVPASAIPLPDKAMEVLGGTTENGQRQLCLLWQEPDSARQWFITLTGNVQIEKARS